MALPQKKPNIFSDICRLCLKEEGYCNVFEETDLISNIYTCIKVKIHLSDKLPQKICFHCLEIIIRATELRRLAKKNQAQLKSYFSVQNEMQESSSEELDEPIATLYIDTEEAITAEKNPKTFRSRKDDLLDSSDTEKEKQGRPPFSHNKLATTKQEILLETRSRSRSPLIKLQKKSDQQSSESHLNKKASDAISESNSSSGEEIYSTKNSERRRGRGPELGLRDQRGSSEFSNIRVTSEPVANPKVVIDSKIQEEKLFLDSMKGVAQAIHKDRYEIEDESENSNIYNLYDDINLCSDSLLVNEDFHFKWISGDTFVPQRESFLVEHTGSVKTYTSEYDAFRSYWDNAILKYIVEQTNLYASKIKSSTFRFEWFPTNSHEILCLFAFWIVLGIVRMPTIRSCFSKNPVLRIETFHRIFSQNRYENLVRALNFIDFDGSDVTNSSSNRQTLSSFDSLYHLRPIIHHLNKQFKDNYVLSQNICIDESLTQWNGKLDISQHIPSNAAKFGIRTLELCESTSGYLWSFIVDTSKQGKKREETSIRECGVKVVNKLVGPLLNKGYRLYMDNEYNSPCLARWLKRNHTDFVGTLDTSNFDVPPSIYKIPLNEGQLIVYYSGDVCVLSWQSQKRTNMISTCHGSEFQSHSGNKLLPEPRVIKDHKKYMGGVDLKDDMLDPYLIERKRSSRGYMKFFKRLLNVSISNARILLQSSIQTDQDHLSFRLALVESVLDKHLPHSPLSARRSNTLSRSLDSSILLTHNKHWLVRLPSTKVDLANNRQSRKGCVLCRREGRKNQKTAYECEACHVALCVDYCMKKFHIKNFS